MKFVDNLKRLPGSWYFLGVVVLLYAFLSIFNLETYLNSLNFFGQIIYRIIPVFILVFILMTLSNYFITPQFILKHLKEKGLRKWFFVIIGGILSSGPIYMWYPLLGDLRKRGLNYGLIACFLYNRAIKIPLLPLAVLYFSWQYILVLTIVMVVFSIIQGVLINKLMEVKNEDSGGV